MFFISTLKCGESVRPQQKPGRVRVVSSKKLQGENLALMGVSVRVYIKRSQGCVSVLRVPTESGRMFLQQMLNKANTTLLTQTVVTFFCLVFLY